MATMVHFDTLKYAETLKDAGMPEKQAKALAHAQQEALSESLDTTLATKTDILGVKSEIAEVKSEVRLLKWMIGFVFAGVASLILKTFF